MTGQVLDNVVGQLYPAVSFQGYSKVKVNFGMDENAPFKYEPEGDLRLLQPLIRRTRTRERSSRMSPDSVGLEYVRARYDRERYERVPLSDMAKGYPVR